MKRDVGPPTSGKRILSLVLAAGVACAGWPSSGRAQSPSPEERRIQELERKIEILAAELERLKEEQALATAGNGSAPSPPRATNKHFSERVASARAGRVSIGGYGEASWRTATGDDDGQHDRADLTRLVLYLGYKFSKRFAVSSEIELEHATTGEGDEEKGEVSAEFVHLDALLSPRLNVRAGLVLMPVGFLNERHEPPFYHGNRRPELEQRIIPTTWRALGAGVYGRVSDRLSYRTYLVTSLDAAGFSPAGIRDARQSGSKSRAEDFSWVGRLDYDVAPGVTVGAAAYLGNQGQNRSFAGKRPDVFTQLYEGHLSFKARGLELRALGTLLEIDDADVLSSALGETIARRMSGYYVEAAYDLMSWLFPQSDQYLAPWVRYSRVDTQDDVPTGFARDRSQDIEIIEVGLSYKPIDRIVLKLDWRTANAPAADLPDELRLGGGFEF